MYQTYRSDQISEAAAQYCGQTAVFVDILPLSSSISIVSGPGYEGNSSTDPVISVNNDFQLTKQILDFELTIQKQKSKLYLFIPDQL